MLLTCLLEDLSYIGFDEIRRDRETNAIHMAWLAAGSSLSCCTVFCQEGNDEGMHTHKIYAGASCVP
ncbi:hypothetical protein KSC_108800 [Ktedonobacter sp. SOSP1-52]|nr:hypothetical protein KSC_108800 [Ktedonobacter sp. SOSP1-52]